MKTNHTYYEFNENTITLFVKPAPRLLSYFFLLLGVISALVPLAGLSHAIKQNDGLHIGIFVGIGAGIFLATQLFQ